MAAMIVAISATVTGGVLCALAARTWRRMFFILAQERIADLDESIANYTAMHAEIDRLRCYQLDEFFADELAPAQRAAFEQHLGRCEACQAGLGDLVQIARIADASERRDLGGEA